MKLRRRQRWLALAPFAAAVVGVVGIASWFLLSSSTMPEIEFADVPSSSADPSRSQVPPLEAIGVEERFRRQLTNAVSTQDKLSVLDSLLQDNEASSEMFPLQDAIRAEKAAVVRIKAFDIARQLANREGRDAVTRVLAEAIDNPYPDVRREGLRACASNPRYELFDVLMRIANGSSQERFLAVQALAFLDEPAAQEKVLEMAKSEDVPKPERLRAIALLSQSSLTVGTDYLQSLMYSDDPELRIVAAEALAVSQRRRTSRE